MVRVDDQSPSDLALGWQMLVVVLRREGLLKLSDYFATTAVTSIDAGKRSSRARVMKFVEGRTGRVDQELRELVKRH